jgi:hypothetical protein
MNTYSSVRADLIREINRRAEAGMPPMTDAEKCAFVEERWPDPLAAVQAERERCLKIIKRDYDITGLQYDNAKQSGRKHTFGSILLALGKIRDRIESGETP